MASKVRVYAKSQKWAALGIIDAYIKMYPHATVDDLNKAFPLSALQETKTDEPLLVTVTEKEKLVKASKTFEYSMLDFSASSIALVFAFNNSVFQRNSSCSYLVFSLASFKK